MTPAVSPFPGMDPYLEWHWGDVHARLVMYACDALQDRLPAELRARVEERVYLEADLEGGRTRKVVPDVRVVEGPRPGRGGGGVALAEPPPARAAAVITEPVILRLDHERMTEGHIEIRDWKSGGRVVTLIEVVSPGNKSGGEGEAKYRRKQQEMRDGGANLVEIDLLRGGHHVLNFPYEHLPSDLDTPYRVCVTRVSAPETFEWYPIRLPDRLPTLGVPLRQSDPDVPLDVQALLAQAYRNGRYDDIDYRGEPRPPLARADSAWADELLKGKGVR